MLEALRRGITTSWLSYIMIALLIAAFAVWGVTDIFTGSSEQVVASVGSTDITAEQFRRDFQAEVNRQSQATRGQYDTQRARAEGLDLRVLADLIDSTAFRANIAELGLTVSDDQIRESIVNDGSFVGPFGQFDRAKFEQLLSLSGYTEAQYVDFLRFVLSREQLVESVSSGIQAPVGMTELIYKYRREQRMASYIVMPPEAAGKIAEPTEEDLRAYHKAHTDDFTDPERRDFQFLLITPEKLSNDVNVSEEEIKELYDFRRDNYVTPEKRQVEQITFADEESARAASMSIEDGVTFLKIALDQGKSPDDIALGEVTIDDLSTEVGEAVFKLEKDEISKPIKGPFGWVIARVLSVTEGSTQTLEEVSDSIRQQIALEKAGDSVFELAGVVEDALAEGATLAEAAARAALTLTTVKEIARTGQVRDGAPIDDLSTYPVILQTAFTQDVDEESEIRDTNSGGYYFIEVQSITPPELLSLETVRDRVVEGWRDDALREKLKNNASALAERANGGSSFKQIADELGRAPVTEEVPRFGENETFSREVVDLLFKAAEGETVFGPVGSGQSYIVAKLDKITQPTPSDNANEIAALRLQLGDFISRSLTRQYLEGVKDDMGVVTYPQVVRRTLGDG